MGLLWGYYSSPLPPPQGFKLLTVRLSGIGKKSGGQVNVLGTFPKERLEFYLLSLVVISGTFEDRQQ